MRKAVIITIVAAGLIVGGASAPALAASAGISPNSQSTTGAGTAHWTETWSGGAGTFYPASGGSLGSYPAASSFTYGFSSCPSTHTLGQELDVYSGTTFVAGATSSTKIIHTSPC
jgi:hypothetical protein